MRVTSAAAVALCLLTLGGCAGAPAQPGVEALPVPLRGATVASPEDDKALHEAEERAITLCMRTRGFSYQPVPARQRPFPESPYGLLPEDQAAVDGYGLAAVALTDAPHDPNEEPLSRLDDAGRAAWHGALTGSPQHLATFTAPGAPTLTVNTDGCVFAGRETLYGQGWEQRRLTVEGLGADVVSRVTANPGFRAAQDSWAACMRRSGEDVGSLLQARGLIQDAVSQAGGDRGLLQKVARSELRMARHDAACQRQARLAAATHAAQDRVEATVPQTSWQVVLSAMERRQRVLKSFRAGQRGAYR